MTIKSMLFVAVSLALAVSAAASQGADKGHPEPLPAGSKKEYSFGTAGNPSQVWRTLTVTMNDGMRFDPDDIKVRQDETVRFVVKNQGSMYHELVLGRTDDLVAHGKEMRANSGMAHTEPYMVQVEPGKEAQLVWHFTKTGRFAYGCLVPGHLDAGMVGKITVTK